MNPISSISAAGRTSQPTRATYPTLLDGIRSRQRQYNYQPQQIASINQPQQSSNNQPQQNTANSTQANPSQRTQPAATTNNNRTVSRNYFRQNAIGYNTNIFPVFDFFPSVRNGTHSGTVNNTSSVNNASSTAVYSNATNMIRPQTSGVNAVNNNAVNNSVNPNVRRFRTTLPPRTTPETAVITTSTLPQGSSTNTDILVHPDVTRNRQTTLADYQAMVSRRSRDAQATIDRLLGKSNADDSVIESQKKVVSELKKKMVKFDGLLRKSAADDAEIRDLKNILEHKNKLLDEMRSSHASGNALSEMRQTIRYNQRDINKYLDKIEKLEDKNRETEGRLNKLSRKSNADDSKIAELKNENNQLEEQLKNAEVKHKGLWDEFAVQKRFFVEAEAAIDDLNAEVITLIVRKNNFIFESDSESKLFYILSNCLKNNSN